MGITLSVRLSGSHTFLVFTHSYVGNTCIPRNAATFFNCIEILKPFIYIIDCSKFKLSENLNVCLMHVILQVLCHRQHHDVCMIFYKKSMMKKVNILRHLFSFSCIHCDKRNLKVWTVPLIIIYEIQKQFQILYMHFVLIISLCQLHRSVGHDRCKLSRACERSPTCDDEITKNDRFVIKIICIHWIMYLVFYVVPSRQATCQPYHTLWWDWWWWRVASWPISYVRS